MEKVKVIKADAIVEISIGTEFYQKIINMVKYLIEDKTQEEYQKALETIKSGTVTEEWVKHLETLLTLCAHYEKIIVDKGLIEEIDA